MSTREAPGLPGRRGTWVIAAGAVAALALGIGFCTGGGGSPGSNALARLGAGRDTGALVTFGPDGRTPDFAGGLNLPTDIKAIDERSAAEAATALLGDNSVFGIADPAGTLAVLGTRRDDLGMHHVNLGQVFSGVEVFGATVDVHFAPDGSRATAVGNHFIPGVDLATVEPAIPAGQAAETAVKRLGGGEAAAEPRLVVYAGVGSTTSGEAAHLCWLVDVSDDSQPARKRFLVDATDGKVVDVLELLFDARTRQVNDAGGRDQLPGAPARQEGSAPSTVPEVDQAYDLTGRVYDYFLNTHGWDSYDGRGSPLVSTVRLGQCDASGRCGKFTNAFWDGNGKQMAYGDGLLTDDISGHEITHGVVGSTANLVYRWQSGALNESYADIFGTMVDGGDWTMGEDSALGVIRDMAFPERYGNPPHPNHTARWIATCKDNGGVHQNSGLHNRAYFNAAQALTSEVAEKIFFRALVYYLGPNSTFENAYGAAYASAQDLHGPQSREAQAVSAAFEAVGLDGAWEPPTPNCSNTALEGTPRGEDGR